MSTPSRAEVAAGFWSVFGAVLAFSLVGILAGVLPIATPALVGGRSVAALAAILAFRWACGLRIFPPVPARLVPWLLVACAGLCGNWFFFFLAIELSSVSVAVLSLFAYPLFTSLLEPILLRVRWNRTVLLASCLVPVGIFLLLPGWDPGDRFFQGVMAGLASGLTLSFANVANRRLVPVTGQGTLLVYPFLAASLVFGPHVVLVVPILSLEEILGMVVLGAVLTTTAQLLLLGGFKRLPAGTTALLLSLQPVVTVILAVLFLGERPGIPALIGGLLILLAVVAARFPGSTHR